MGGGAFGRSGLWEAGRAPGVLRKDDGLGHQREVSELGQGMAASPSVQAASRPLRSPASCRSWVPMGVLQQQGRGVSQQPLASNQSINQLISQSTSPLSSALTKPHPIHCASNELQRARRVQGTRNRERAKMSTAAVLKCVPTGPSQGLSSNVKLSQRV